MKIKIFYTKYKWCFILALVVSVVKILSFFPSFITVVYSEAIYPEISALRWRFFGQISFSVGDVIYVITGFCIIYFFVKQKEKTLPFVVNYLAKCVTFFYLFFNLLWGFNYYRIPFSEIKNINYEYSYLDLLSFTYYTIDNANQLHLDLVQNDCIKVEYPYEIAEIFQKAEVFQHKLYTKKSLISLPLSYMGFGGYINPFTCESQVNQYLPKYLLPTVALHEMAHQIGYASESEANYIAYHKARVHSDLYFRYSAELFALRYCMRQIEKQNPQDYQKLSVLIYKGVWKSFNESKAFKEKFQTPLDVFFDYFYHYFLKVNAQEEGIGEYSKFLGLLINEHNKIKKF